MKTALAGKPVKDNISWHKGLITKEKREKLHSHKGAVIWFTGLSASGKSTIANYVEEILYNLGCSTYVFDGDNVRHGLCKDLSFTENDRVENIRRIGEMVNLFLDAGIIAITAFISPFRNDRRKVRDIVGESNFFEIYVDCPIEACIERDPKGIYKKALKNEISDFTGISSPYEVPENPDAIIKSNEEDFNLAAQKIVNLLIEKKVVYVQQ